MSMSFAKTLDIQMLVLTHEGKERTHAEWKEFCMQPGLN